MSHAPFRTYLSRIATALRLRCPSCGRGKLFTGPLRMRSQCPCCQMCLEPEPGFYLGSVYANYGATVLLALTGFISLVLGLGVSKDVAIWACFGFSLLYPLWFFRYARSIWLSLMYQVSSSDFHKPASRRFPTT